MVPGDDPLVSELAVSLVPDVALDGSTAATVAGVFTTWQGRVKPTETGGLWIMSLTPYSCFDPGKHALLALERMTYPLIGPAEFRSGPSKPAGQR